LEIRSERQCCLCATLRQNDASVNKMLCIFFVYDVTKNKTKVSLRRFNSRPAPELV
jgi:hypothetical protein